MFTHSLAVRWCIGVLVLGGLGLAEAQSEVFFRHVAGDVLAAKVTPDGTRVVFVGDLQFDQLLEIFSVPSDGSAAPLQLNPPLVAHGDVSDNFEFSPDGQYVAYYADAETDGVVELYSVPVDGSATAECVSAGVAHEFVTGSVFTPDSTRLVFGIRTLDGRDKLWCAALDGSGAVEVSGSLNPGGNVLDRYLVSPDSTRVVYVADAVTDGVPELFSGLLDGSAVVKLSPTPAANGNMRDYAFTPDGARVIYDGDVTTNNTYELYSVPTDGSAAAIRISRAPGALTNVETGFGFTPAGDVIYRADHDEENCSALYLVPADGSATAVRLNGALDPDEDCEDFVVTSDGYVVYRADQDTNNVIELYAVPLDGSQTTVKLSGTMVNGGDVQVDYPVSTDGARVVYRADQDTDGVFELYGVPRDGSSAPVKLNGALGAGPGVARGTPIDPSDAFVVFVSNLTSDADSKLQVAPLDGSSAPVVLNDVGLAEVLTLSGTYGFGAGGTIVYRGVLDTLDPDFVEEAFVVPLDASASALALHPKPALGPLDGDILTYEPTNDGASIVYVAREKTTKGLYIAQVDDPTSAVRLTGGDDLQILFTLSADSQRAAYCVFDPAHANNELYSLALDGSTPPVRLSGPLVSAGAVQLGFAFTPDSARVVYLADAEVDGRFELYSALADGSGVPVKLSGALVANGDVTTFRLAADSARVVYLADQDLDTRPELYSAPVDGSAAPVRLNGTLPLSCQVRDDYLVSPDGTRVFYRADESVLASPELYAVPIDGSAAATKLSGTLPSGGLVNDYKLSLSGALVVYRAKQDASFRFDLYAVLADGSAAAVLLDGALVSGGNVGGFAITGDGANVVFEADLAVNDRFEVFTVPSDASAAPQRVHPALSGNSDAGLLLLTPDGTRVLYSLTTTPGGPHDVYTTPRDASAAPVRLNEPFLQGRDTRGLLVSPDSGTLVYASDEEHDNRFELYSVPSDGSAPRVKISGIMTPQGGVEQTFRISQDSTHAFFIADLEVDEVFELFQFTLGGGLLRSGGGGGKLPKLVHPPLVDPRDYRGANAPGRSVSRPAGL